MYHSHILIFLKAIDASRLTFLNLNSQVLAYTLALSRFQYLIIWWPNHSEANLPYRQVDEFNCPSI